MELKNGLPAAFLEGKNAHPLIAAYFEFNHLKQLYRQGWLKRGISKEHCESVAEHTFGVAVLAYFLAEAYFPVLDANKVIRMALVHDFGEIYAGDIMPSDPVTPQEKHERELESVRRVFEPLPNGPALLAVWDEFESGHSPEARFVRQIDRLEMALQASVYEYQGAISMQEFFETARLAMNEAELQDLMEAIQSSRAKPFLPEE